MGGAYTASRIDVCTMTKLPNPGKTRDLGQPKFANFCRGGERYHLCTSIQTCIPASSSPFCLLNTETKMHGLVGDDSPLIRRTAEYVKQYMSHYDGSHDYSHVLRVLSLARQIASADPSIPPKFDSLVVTLAALLHDVGDKKYLKPGEESTTMVRDLLASFGVDSKLGEKVQAIVSAVSYSSEVKNPERVKEVVDLYPELAVVQDADRLDAIGAIGVGRAFTYGGAQGGKGRGRGMGETIEHFTEKLERLEGMMKTEEGRRMARERTERLKLFRRWWEEETAMAGGILAVE